MATVLAAIVCCANYVAIQGNRSAHYTHSAANMLNGKRTPTNARASRVFHTIVRHYARSRTPRTKRPSRGASHLAAAHRDRTGRHP